MVLGIDSSVHSGHHIVQLFMPASKYPGASRAIPTGPVQISRNIGRLLRGLGPYHRNRAIYLFGDKAYFVACLHLIEHRRVFHAKDHGHCRHA